MARTPAATAFPGAALFRLAPPAVLVAVLAAALPAGALPQSVPPKVGPDPESLPRELVGVGFDQRLGEPLPLDARFRDESGREVTLGSFFGRRPVLLAPTYYRCPMLCTLVTEGVAAAARELPFDAGEEYEVVFFSFDPEDTPEAARAKKEVAVARSGRRGTGDGWHFLTGEPDSIRRLTRAIGFRYERDESGEFSHVAGVVVATPEGKIARYFFGIDYPPRDLRLALVEASDEKVGSLVDQVLLFCFRYDPATGRYSVLTLNLVRVAGSLTAAALLFGVVFMLRRERRHPGPPPHDIAGGSA